MGMGVWTHEDIVYDPTTGAVLTNRTWNYHPPGMKDIPIDFRVTLKKDSPNPVGVARSKGMCIIRDHDQINVHVA
ncbi:unnamed protein product, partial [Timema podura]|nr:unnamed protein product [Timema podura]